MAVVAVAASLVVTLIRAAAAVESVASTKVVAVAVVVGGMLERFFHLNIAGTLKKVANTITDY